MDSGDTDNASRTSDLDQARFQWEVEKGRQELALREKELKSKTDELRRSAWTNPIFLSIVAAAIGLFGNAIVTLMQGRNSESIQDRANIANITLEREKLHSTLIVESMKTGNAIDAANNLHFLVEVGLLDDVNGTIRKFYEHPENAPFLPSPGQNPARYGLMVFNGCLVEAYVLLYYKSGADQWVGYGWYRVPPREKIMLPVAATSPHIYVYARTSDGKIEWSGDNKFAFEGKDYGFKELEMGTAKSENIDNISGALTYSLKCDN